MAIVLCIVGIASMHFAYLLPNIQTDASGLKVEFVLGWADVNWDEILEIKQVYAFREKGWLVSAEKITLFHSLYGLQYGPTLSPGFLIWESLPNSDELISTIKNNLSKVVK